MTVTRISIKKEENGKALIPTIPFPEVCKGELKFTKRLVCKKGISKEEKPTPDLRLNMTVFIEQSKKPK